MLAWITIMALAVFVVFCAVTVMGLKEEFIIWLDEAREVRRF